MQRRMLVALFVILLPAVTPRIYASDEIQYFAFLRSLWFDHDLSFDNEYRYFEAHRIGAGWGFHETNVETVTETGLRLNYGTIGCALLWAPFYAVGDLTARILHATGRPVPVDGYSKPYVAAVCYGSAVYGFAAVLMSAAIARRLAGPPLAAAVAVWIGTPLLFYMYLAPVFAHACEAFAVALFLLTWLRNRDRWTTRGLIALGAAAALMVMMREQDVFFVAGPAVDYLIALRADFARGVARPQRVVSAIAGAVAALVVYLPQVIAYIVLNGHIGPSHLVTRKMFWYAPHAWGVLFSPEHGLMFWTPLALLGLAGLVTLALRGSPAAAAAPPSGARQMAWLLLLMAALQVYVAGSVASWTVAGAFGQRRFVSLTPILIVGLAALFDRVRDVPWLRRGVTAGIVLSVWWNLGLMAQFGLHTMDRQRLTIGANARQTFVDLPREAPGLAWRYLTDRASFYNQPQQ